MSYDNHAFLKAVITLGKSAFVSLLAYFAARSFIPIVIPYCLKRNIQGKDLGKLGTELAEVPV